jgi:hypothetical protein
MYKNICLAITGANYAIIIGCMFERASGRCPKGNYPPLPCLAGSNCRGRRSGDSIELPVHPMLAYLFNSHGKKGSEAHVKGKIRNINPSRLNFLQKLLGEMQASRGSRNSSAVAGKNCLVS